MIRTPIQQISKGDRSHYVRIESSIASQIRTAKEASRAPWVAWVGEAMSRLRKESPIEIESLIMQAQFVAASKKDKARLPFRMLNADFDEARVMALKYNVDIQSVLVAALHLYSFVSSMALPDEHDIENMKKTF